MINVKKITLATLASLLIALCAFVLMACASTNQNAQSNSTDNQAIDVNASSQTENLSDLTLGGDTLVAYFSATGNTADIAYLLAEELDADIFAIEPLIPYTQDDLNYMNSQSRASMESRGQSVPEIGPSLGNMEKYDVIYLGYPIWFGNAPAIINEFLKSYELEGKTIVPFCTSASVGIAQSVDNLSAEFPDATWEHGHRFAAGDTDISPLLDYEWL